MSDHSVDQVIAHFQTSQELVAVRAQRDALLAVAKAVDASAASGHMFTAAMRDGLDTLDTAHPGWREWT